MTNNKDTQSNHVTPIDGNIFLDLGFSREEAEELIKKADTEILEDIKNETE